MYRILILTFIAINLTPSVNAFTTYSDNHMNNNFNSRLKMNNSNITVSDYGDSIRSSRNSHCPDCYANGNYYRQFNKPIPKSSLKKLEKYVWGRNFSNENDLSRLERLEELAFGAIQAGDYTTRYNNVASAIMSRPKYKTKNNFLSSLGSIITGQATGLTPNITTQELNGYDRFAPFGGDYFAPGYRGLPSYGNNMVEHYSNGLFGGGWGSFHNSTGTGSGITILP